MTPLVHLNGTSKAELLLQRSNAVDALRLALIALNEMSPNGRDYYPEPGRLEQAQAEHEARFLAVRAVRESIYEEIVALTTL